MKAIAVRPTRFRKRPGSSGATAGLASWGRGAAAAFFWSSFSTISFTQSASGSAQISRDFSVVNLQIKRNRKGNTRFREQRGREGVGPAALAPSGLWHSKAALMGPHPLGESKPATILGEKKKNAAFVLIQPSSWG